MRPLAGCDPNSLSIVLNGIVENYRELKESLGADGHLHRDRRRDRPPPRRAPLRGRPRRSCPSGVSRARGALLVRRDHRDHPGLLVGATPGAARCRARRGRELPRLERAAFLRETRTVQFPGDGEIVAITPTGDLLDGGLADRPARHRGARLGRRGCREGRLRDVHAQGDPRQPEPSPRQSATRSATARSSCSRGSACPTRSSSSRSGSCSSPAAPTRASSERYIIEEWGTDPRSNSTSRARIYRNPVVDEHALVIERIRSRAKRATRSPP